MEHILEHLSGSVIQLLIILSAIVLFMTVLAYFSKKQNQHKLFDDQFLFWLSWCVLFFANPINQNPYLISLNLLVWPWVCKNVVRIMGHAYGKKFFQENLYKIMIPFYLAGAVLALAGFSFTVFTFPPVFGVCSYLMYYIFIILKEYRFLQQSTYQKLLLCFSLAFALHGYLYPLLRLNLEIVQYDFIFMLCNVIGFSVTVPNIIFNAYYTELNNKLLDQIELEKSVIKGMVATVNHELNNPLAVLQGRVEVAKVKKDMSKLDRIIDDVQKIKAIMNKINHISQRNLNKEDYISDRESDTKIYKL